MVPVIEQALSVLGATVCHVPYRGTERQYITYQSTGQDTVLYAEGREEATSTGYVVNTYAEGPRLTEFMLAAKEALEAAGWIVEVDQEIYEPETDLHRFSLYATKEGANYG